MFLVPSWLPCIHLYGIGPCGLHMQWTNGLQQETQAKLPWCGTGSSSNTERTLWRLVLILDLLKPQILLLWCWETERNGTLETQGCNSTGINLSTILNLSRGASGNAYSSSTPRTPLPWPTGRDEVLSPPVANDLITMTSNSKHCTSNTPRKSIWRPNQDDQDETSALKNICNDLLVKDTGPTEDCFSHCPLINWHFGFPF